MKISELIKELATAIENWGDIDVLVDDGRDFFDDVTLKVSHLDEIYSAPSIRIHSPKQLGKDAPK